MEYYPDPIGAFNDGCLMDLKFKTAISFANSILLSGAGHDSTSQNVAAFAIGVSEELFKIGKERGLIQSLPESGELNAAMKRHLERAVNAQLYQQTVAQREQRSQLRPVGLPMNG